MPSFDIVSQVNSMEIENAVNIAKKELATRFDFKGTKAEIVLEKKCMNAHAPIPGDSGQAFGHNPFGALSREGLPPAPENSPGDSGHRVEAKQPGKNRGRVDITRQKAGRGGKTVTVVKGFIGIGLLEKEQLAKAIQKACGTGGTVKHGQIEIQGDKRAEVARILSRAGFRPVFGGG